MFFIPIHSVAAVRPSELTLFPFLFSYAHGRYAIIGRSHELETLVSRDLGYLRVMCLQFAYSYVSRYLFT